MNDIEAAAVDDAFYKRWCSMAHLPNESQSDARRWFRAGAALAHAARGEPVRSWRDVEGTLPARRDGDKVARVDEMVPWFLAPTPPPATGEAERCEDHGREGCIDCEPATGEAGTRGEVERVRAAVIDAAKAFRAHDETYLIANYENVAEEGERQRLIVKMLVAVDALLAAERSENGGDRG